MVTLGVALLLGELANALPHISGGADGLQGVIMGKLLGRFEFDLFGRTAYAYSLTTLFVLLLLARRIVHSPFGLSLMSIRRNALRAACARRAGPTAAWSRSILWRRPMPGRQARCSRRPRPTSRSRCWSSSARPTCCSC